MNDPTPRSRDARQALRTLEAITVCTTILGDPGRVGVAVRVLHLAAREEVQATVNVTGTRP